MAGIARWGPRKRQRLMRILWLILVVIALFLLQNFLQNDSLVSLFFFLLFTIGLAIVARVTWAKKVTLRK